MIKISFPLHLREGCQILRHRRTHGSTTLSRFDLILINTIWGVLLVVLFFSCSGWKKLEIILYAFPLWLCVLQLVGCIHAVFLIFQVVFEWLREHINFKIFVWTKPKANEPVKKEPELPPVPLEPAPVKKAPAKPKTRNNAKAKYKAMYGGKPYTELISVPDDVYFSSDGIPHIKGNNKKSRYAFVLSYEDCYLHKPPCQLAKGFWINISQLQELHNHRYIYDNCVYEPCPLCQPEFPDMSWYREYQRIKGIKEKYGIK